jgi:hypothetical protein
VTFGTILLQMLLQETRATTDADAQQAKRWREWLLQERSESAAKLTKQKNHYERCAGLVDARKLTQFRRAIRSLEHEIRTIDDMIYALARRFTDETETLRRLDSCAATFRSTNRGT